MSGSIQPEPRSSSRRALLAGALGGIGAWAASVIGRASPVRATDGQALVVGQVNTTAGQTTLGNNASDDIVMWVASNTGAGFGGGTGVVGYSDHGIGLQGQTASGTGARGISSTGYGIYGSSDSNDAVRGVSTSGIGINGASDSHIAIAGLSNLSNGVLGDSNSTSVAGIAGRSFGNSTGVQGYSGPGGLPAAKPKTGVFGYAAQDTSSRGVWGESPAGIGVYGRTTTGFAGYFQGKVFTSSFHEMIEVSTPAAPGANRARLFVRDNGAGKTQLCVRFATGSVKLLAQEA